MTTLWKFMYNGLKSKHGEVKWKIGEWQKEEKIEICNSGFHASVNPAHALKYVQGDVLSLVEVRGESAVQGDKQCWSEMRIVKAYSWKKEDSIAFSIYAAEKVIGIFEKEYPKDDRPRKAIEAAKEWLKDPSEKNRTKAADAAHAAAHPAHPADPAHPAYAANTAANAANAAKIRGNLWKELGAWMEKHVKSLEEYK